MMNINVDFVQWSITVLIKKTSGSGFMTNHCPLDLATPEVAEELQKLIIRKFEKKTSKVTSYRQYLGC